jgi:molecular chaperone GrpE
MTDVRNEHALPASDSPVSAPEATDRESAGDAATSGADPLAAALAERDECRDKLLRAYAELENFRKRVQREREEDRRYAAAPLARDLFPILDNLRRAVEAAEKGGTIDDLRQGVAMVLQQAQEVLAKHHVQAIAAVGQPFDPNLHEALTQVPSAEHPPMTVVQEAERGYLLHDRVLRPAKVIVSAQPGGDGAPPKPSSP